MYPQYNNIMIIKNVKKEANKGKNDT
jgi:hypothetical protein